MSLICKCSPRCTGTLLCNDWEMLEEKAVQFGMEKKQSTVGSRDSQMWRLLTVNDRLAKQFWLMRWIACC